jgi:hypothetical protein
MSEEIQYLEKRMESLMSSKEQGQKVMKKINYIMMMHS